MFFLFFQILKFEVLEWPNVLEGAASVSARPSTAFPLKAVHAAHVSSDRNARVVGATHTRLSPGLYHSLIVPAWTPDLQSLVQNYLRQKWRASRWIRNCMHIRVWVWSVRSLCTYRWGKGRFMKIVFRCWVMPHIRLVIYCCLKVQTPVAPRGKIWR